MMYKQVSIKINGIWKPKRVHRVVMEQFIKRHLNSNECVHHKNGNKLDNRIENLEIVSRGEHAKIHKHRLKTGKFSPELVRKVRALYSTGNFSFRQVGKVIGISKSQAQNVFQGRSYQWVK